ncbi:MAG TPA: SCO family protein [Steroidobacteraceae bacterium]|nr:SCO family protein [Steroidobacteraceae bacterium]
MTRSHSVRSLLPCLALLGLGLLAPCLAAAGGTIDATDLSYRERPGNAVPMGLAFQDADGARRSLADIARGRPLILVPAYYDCTSLCGLVRSSLYGALAQLNDAGSFALAILSIDPQEHRDSARMAQSHDREAIARVPGLAPHYLTGSTASIHAVTDAVGFRYRRDPLSGQFLHPAGIVFLTARGTVSNYLLGVGYTPSQVRSGLQRAQSGRLAQIGAPLLLLCFHLDEATGRYTLETLKVLRLTAAFAVLTLVGLLALLFRRERT